MTRLPPPGEPAGQPSMNPVDSSIGEQGGRFSRWSFARRLSVISGLALALRLAYVLFVERGDPLSGDALYYHEAARLLADGFGFIEPYRYLHGGAQELLFVGDPSQVVETANSALPIGHVEPTAGHPPLWVLVLGAATLVGFDTVLGHQLIGALVGTVAVAAVGWAGRQMGGERVGLIAAALAAGYAFLWLNDGLVMSESLVVLLVAVAVGVALRFHRRPDWAGVVTLGLLGGLAGLTRAELLLFLPLAALPVLRRSDLEFRERARRYIAVGVVAAAVLSPWMIRNLTRFDEPVLVSNGSGILVAQTNCDATYYGDKQGYWEYLCGLPQPVGAHGEPLDESRRDAEYRDRGLNYASRHWPRLVVHAIPKRVGRLWGVYAPIQQLRADKLVEGRTFKLSVLGLVQYWFLLPLAGMGVLTLRRSGRPLMPLLAWPLVVTVVAALTMGATRYRVPAEVALVLLAAVSLDALASHYRGRWWHRTNEGTARTLLR